MQRYHYQTTAQLNQHLQAFLLTYNHAKRLKQLRGLTPHEFIWPSGKSHQLSLLATQLTLGLYT